MVIYWTVPNYSNDIYLGLDSPKSAFADFKKNCPQTSIENTFANFTLCPSVTDFSKNLFTLKSPLSIEFKWTGEDIIFKETFSEDFFKKIVVLRDIKGGSLSLRICPYFFFTEDECEMQFTAPLLDHNNFIDNCMVVPGQINIGKWFRPTDLAFLIKHKNQNISINKGDTISNIRFLTNEKITFKKFYYTDTCEDLFSKVIYYKNSQTNKVKDYFKVVYADFLNSKIKNKILTEIKNNLME